MALDLLMHNNGNAEWNIIISFSNCKFSSCIDPCLFDSTCENTTGFFRCVCPPGREGHRCQYEIRCNNSSLCTEGETCVETVANPSGYVCISTPVSERLQIQLSDDVTTNQVNEALYRLVSIYIAICL